jgi:hypothetical protein
MKKLFLVGAVVFLAAAFFGCSEQALEEDAPEYDEQGRRIVKFSVPTRAYEKGGIRALSNVNARASWDYIEIVFKRGDPEEYQARSAPKGQDVYFSLAEGAYQAVMFVGYANGTKLLAIGVPTKTSRKDGTVIDDNTDGKGEITIVEETDTIEFTLFSLTLDIIVDAAAVADFAAAVANEVVLDVATTAATVAGKDVSSSAAATAVKTTVAKLAADIATADSVSDADVTAATAATAAADVAATTAANAGNVEIGGVNRASTIKPVIIDDKATPYFRVDKGTSNIEGTFTINGFNNNDSNLVGVPDTTTDLLADTGTLTQGALFGIRGTGTTDPPVMDISDPAHISNKIITAIGLPFYKPTTSENFSPVALTPQVTSIKIEGGALKIAFKFDTPPQDGFSKIRFDVPIQAFHSGPVNPDLSAPFYKGNVWHIVNGFAPGAMDLGGDAIGQNILLAIGSNPTGQIVLSPSIP